MPGLFDLDDIIAGADDPPLSLFGPGAAATDAPETSQDAAAQDFAGARRAILALAIDAGTEGITSRDVVGEGICPSTNEAGSRLQELRGLTRGDVTWPRLLWRVVHAATGRLVIREGCAVHVYTAHQLPDGWAWQPEPVVRLCKSCGQRVRQAPATGDGTVAGDPA